MATEASIRLTRALIDIQLNPDDDTLPRKLNSLVKYSFLKDLFTPANAPPIANVLPQKAIRVWKVLGNVDRDHFTAAIGRYHHPDDNSTRTYSKEVIDFFKQVSKQRKYIEHQEKMSDEESDSDDERPVQKVADFGSISLAQQNVLTHIVHLLENSQPVSAQQLHEWAIEVFGEKKQTEYIPYPTEYSCTAEGRAECKRIFAMFVSNPYESDDYGQEVISYTQQLVQSARLQQPV